MPTVDVDGTDVYYRDQGEGQGVILLHSSSSTGGQWRQLAEQLADRYRVLVPDLHGYGRTGAWPDARGNVLAGEGRIVETLLGMIDGRVHLVGHSYGGSIAGRVALSHPERLASLVMIEPTLFHLLEEAGEAAAYAEIHGVAEAVVKHAAAGDLETATETFLNYWVGPGALAAMPPERQQVVVGSIVKLRQEWPAAFGSGEPGCADFASITAPLLLIEATETTLAAARVIHVLRGVLPECDHKQVAGAAHMSPVTHPELVNPLIEAHIQRFS